MHCNSDRHSRPILPQWQKQTKPQLGTRNHVGVTQITEEVGERRINFPDRPPLEHEVVLRSYRGQSQPKVPAVSKA